MTWSPWLDVRVRAAAVVAVAAAALLLRTSLTALEPDEVVAAAPWTAPSLPASSPPTAPVDLDRLADLAPFGAPSPAPAQAVAAVTASPITLVGTIAGAEQPAAICRLGDLPPHILHAGDSLGGWRLLQVAPGRAVFIDAAARRHELRLNPAGN
jgi:hypothetical protein